MGDTRGISYGRKPLNSAGLEFAGARKKSRFAQYTQQQQPSTVVPPPVEQFQPIQTAPTALAPVAQPVYAPVQPVQQQAYGEVPHDKVLYPQLSPIDTVEVPVLPDDTVTNELAFDVADTLDENDEFFSDMPKSNIKRPGVALEEEVRTKRKKGLRRSVATLGVFAGIAVLVVSFSLIQRYAPPISATMRKKVAFPVYQMQPNNSFAVNRKSVEFNENSSLVYKVQDTNTKGNFTLSQQAVPEIVKNDESFQQFLVQTDKFASFDTPLGKAYLTKPAGIGTDVSIVLKSDKTLLFIRGPGGTSEQTWANLVTSLKLQ